MKNHPLVTGRRKVEPGAMAMLKPKKPKKPKPKPTGYSWILSPDGMICYIGGTGQTISQLWEAERLTPWHDKGLAKVTTEINAILRRVNEGNHDPRRRASFVEFRSRLFLVWATYDAVGPEEDDTTVADALGLPAPPDEDM